MLSFFRRSPRSRLILLAIVVLVGGVLFAGLGLARPSRQGSPSADRAADARGFDVALDDSRKVTGFVERYGQRVDHAEKELTRKDVELRDLRSEIQKQAKAVGALLGEFEGLRPRSSTEPGRDARVMAPSDPAAALGGLPPDAAPAGAPASPPRIEKIVLPAARKEEELRSRRDEVRIPAGSFAEATLLTGLYASTQGPAQPVQLRVDLTFIGPNRSRIPLQGAFVIGKAVGDPNSTRAVIQLDRISIVRPDGKVLEVPVNGYVADDDGIMGLAGQYVWRIHEAASLAALTGGVAAAADAAASRETLTQINPLGGAAQIVTGDLGRYATARGASRAADEVGRIITRRLDEIVPAIYVPNGKRLTLVLIDGVTLSGLDVKEMRHESSTSPYAGLDLDR